MSDQRCGNVPRFKSHVALIVTHRYISVIPSKCVCILPGARSRRTGAIILANWRDTKDHKYLQVRLTVGYSQGVGTRTVL